MPLLSRCGCLVEGLLSVRDYRRRGRDVYHYMGLPFYRAEFPDSDPEGTEGFLLAMNLGPNGVHLLHAYGSAASLGLQVDPLPVNPSTGTTDYLVHGAFTITTWDPMAMYLAENVTYLSPA